MKNIQQSLHKIRKRAWEHKKALLHMDKAIKEIGLVYEHASHGYETLKIFINEIEAYKRQEYFEYKNALSIFKNYTVFTA